MLQSPKKQNKFFVAFILAENYICIEKTIGNLSRKQKISDS